MQYKFYIYILFVIYYRSGKKAAKQFNVEDMFEKAKRTAMEVSSSRKEGIIDIPILIIT